MWESATEEEPTHEAAAVVPPFLQSELLFTETHKVQKMLRSICICRVEDKTGYTLPSKISLDIP